MSLVSSKEGIFAQLDCHTPFADFSLSTKAGRDPEHGCIPHGHLDRL